ncbi:MAG: VOC family protein [Chloroflexota bacterium]|nr:VOC family protein [Chloroflexota bacterium]
MPESLAQLTQMTLATTRTAEMVKFYDTLFGTGLKPTEAYGTMLYNGNLAGLPLTICPNEIAGVQAEQSRHQLAFRVADLVAILSQVEAAGGSIETPLSEDPPTQAILRDPDDNTIEVTQASD